MARAREGTDAQREPAALRPRLVPDLGALRHRDYRLLWSGMLAMSALMPLQFTTLLLFLRDAAPENLSLLLSGVLGAMRGGVMLLAGIPGGALADRIGRRRLLLIAQGVAIAANGCIAALMLAGVSGAGLAAIFALTFVAGGAMTVDTPARQAFVPQLVPREQLVNAIALDAVAMQLAFPLSLPLTGILIDRLGFGGAFSASLIGHLTVLLMLIQIRHRGTPPAAAGQGRPSMLVQMRDGIAYTRRTPAILWVIVLVLAVMAVGFPPVGTLGPVWVTRVLGLTPGQFGFFGAMWGLGALIGSIAMTNATHVPRKERLVAAGALSFAVCVVLWGYSRSVLLSGGINFALGISLSVMQVSARSVVQRTAPNEMQGRVLSLFMLNMGVSQFMAAPVGALAQAFTLERVVPVLGWVCLALVVGVVTLRRAAGTPSPGPSPAARERGAS